MKFWLRWLVIGVMVVGACALAVADTVPVTWTGDPSVVNYDCPACQQGGGVPRLIASQDATDAGIADFQAVYFSSAHGYGGFSDSVVTDTFTIASPADIALELTAGYGSNGVSCGVTICTSLPWTYTGQFSGSADITDQSGTTLLTVIFGGQGSSSVCRLFGPGACAEGVGAMDAESGMVNLGAGTYNVVLSYSDSDTSIGDSSSSAYVYMTLSAANAATVPEPGHSMFVLLLLLIMVAFRVRFRSLRQSRLR